jgi:hypothetical protein
VLGRALRIISTCVSRKPVVPFRVKERLISKAINLENWNAERVAVRDGQVKILFA